MYLTWRYLWFHKWKSLLLILALTLTLFLPLALHLLTADYERDLMARGEATPLVAGAAGDRYDLVLNGLYFTGKVPAEISFAEASALRAEVSARGLEAGVHPVHSRHRAGGYPLVGTDVEYFRFRGLMAVQGTLPLRIGDCVLGATVAESLELGPGDWLLTDRGTFFDLAGDYPLKMRVTGVLGAADSPDDQAVFTDLKTAWVVDGISHGHDPLDEKTTLENTGTNRVGNAAVFEFQEITEENRDSFHAHLPPEELPLSCLIVDPATAKDQTLLTAAYNLAENRQMLVSESLVTELLGLVFQLKRFLSASFLLVSLATLLFIGIIVLLSLRLRRPEMQTLTKIGARRGTMAGFQVQEWLVLAVAALVLSLVLALVVRAVAPDLSGLM